MIDWVIDALGDSRISAGAVVVGHGGEQLQSHVGRLTNNSLDWNFVEQHEQLGTGHAASLALASLPLGDDDLVLILPGDTPLLRASSITTLLDHHLATPAVLSVLSAVVASPTGYGRMVHDSYGNLAGIVEERDATPEQREIHEINTGIMVGTASALRSALERVGRRNAQGEFYLTDVIGILVAQGMVVRAESLGDPREAQGVNDPEQLASCEAALAERGLE